MDILHIRMDKQQKQDQNDSMDCQPANDFRSIFGMDSSKLAEKFNKLEVEMKKKDEEIMELKLENGKLKEEIEALKAEKSQAYSESSPESTIKGEFSPEMNTRKPPVTRFINWLRDSLPWIDREEMANSSLSTASELFRQLCWPKLHQNVKPYKISSLCIIPFTIPSIPPPDYIIGIEVISFGDVNDQIVNFAENIAHLLHQNCKLVFLSNAKFANWKVDKKRIASTRNLLGFLADKIFEIEFMKNGANMNDIKQLFPGILDHVQSNEGLQVQDYTLICIKLD